MGFLEYYPDFECREEMSGPWQSCKRENMCDLYGYPSVDHVRIVTDNSKYINNFIEKYELACSSKFLIGLIGGIFFFGWMLGSVIITPLADKIGRKKVMLTCMLIQMAVMTTIILNDSLPFLYVGYFITGFCNAGVE